MRNLFGLSLISLLIVMLCSCVDDHDYYRVKIVNDSNNDISVYLTESCNMVYISGGSVIIPKGESFEYTLSIYEYVKKNAYVAFLFSDKEIDIDTDILNQESVDREARKLLFIKYSLQELLQMNCTVTFNGFENE